MDEIETKLDCWGVSQRPNDSALASMFIQELLDQPEDSEPVPLGATVILMPPDDDPDPELASANMRLAEELAAEGRTVILWTVGREPPYTAVPPVPALTTADES